MENTLKYITAILSLLLITFVVIKCESPKPMPYIYKKDCKVDSILINSSIKNKRVLDSLYIINDSLVRVKGKVKLVPYKVLEKQVIVDNKDSCKEYEANRIVLLENIAKRDTIIAADSIQIENLKKVINTLQVSDSTKSSLLNIVKKELEESNSLVFKKEGEIIKLKKDGTKVLIISDIISFIFGLVL
jgi:hypothetical protein